MSRRRKPSGEVYLASADRKITPVKEAYVNLILAIRNQAILDHDLDDWEVYWLHDTEMAQLWQILLKQQHDKLIAQPTMACKSAC